MQRHLHRKQPMKLGVMLGCVLVSWGMVCMAGILCGCENEPAAAGAGPDLTPAVTAPSHPASPAILFFDDFEGASLARFWRPGNYGAGRYAPGAVTLSRDRARTGAASVRVTVKDGDIHQVGGDGLDTERAELDSGAHPVVGRDAWYGYSFLVPAGFPVVDNRLVISQWKQSGIKGGPLVAQRFRNGRHDMTIRVPGGRDPDSDRERYRLPVIRFGKWTDVICHSRFSRDANGLVEIWMDGKQVVRHKGPNVFPGGEDTVYHKFGLYRDRWEQPMTVYFDNYTMGDSYAAVNPARFDQ
jgi:hypothetical protein